MNKFNWTYIGDDNKQYHVGLMHSSRSGHLLVYCNAKIILIDFSILETKTYSFFIEEELCELTIERDENLFRYGLKVNKEADTPRNRLRKKIDKKDLVQSLAFMGAMAFIVFSGFWYFTGSKLNEQHHNISQLLENYGVETTAKIFINEGNTAPIRYAYIANGKAYSSSLARPRADKISIKNGLPLVSGDEFVVEYVSHNPELNRLDLRTPSPIQLKKYKERAIQKHLKYHPELEAAHCNCLVGIGFELKGISGLADFYFQDISAQKNATHNEDSFKQLIRNPSFQKLMKEKCW